ncbi:MAG: hypothetical protein SVU88_00260 [Candidatus Nanohaloarchaea archaeon]|nr:hypothetical protein [Candidatus Nanohaloarchaea archaeon]
MDNINRHDIQTRILERIGYTGPKPFSTVQGDIPSNKLSFHLQQLQDDGLVEQVDAGYRLTAKGTEALPYLHGDDAVQPLTRVTLLSRSDGRVRAEQVENRMAATNGYLDLPSRRARAGRPMGEQARELCTGEARQGDDDPGLVGVLERTIRFDNGARQEQLLLAFEEADAGDGAASRYTVSELEDAGTVPGLATVVDRLHAADHILHGQWLLDHADGELALARVDIATH